MTRPDRGTCEVAGCGEPATGSYLHSAARGAAVEFGVCATHVARLQAGSRPAVVVENGDDGDRRTTLVLD